jgi:hypothetical protein
MPQKEICQCKYKNFHLNNKTFSIKKEGFSRMPPLFSINIIFLRV